MELLFSKTIDPSEIIEERLASSMSLQKYLYLIENCYKTDISSDRQYQKAFNSFYIVRRNENWRNTYYSYFEQVKNTGLGFEQILMHLYHHCGSVEASFSSKMLSTIDPTMPVWDQYIIKNLNISLPSLNDSHRLNKIINLYGSLVEWYAQFLGTEEAKTWIGTFDASLPHYSHISSVKKIDFFLWSIRE